MTWIAFVLIGQFLNALAVIVDKHIVTSKIVSKPITYTFYVGLLSIIALGALPFGVVLPTTICIIASLIGAIFYIISIYLLYESLQHSDPSDSLPIIGGVSALTTFFASYLILGQNLPNHFIAGFFILVLGMMLISHFKFDRATLFQIIGSGAFFGMSTIMIKIVFINDTFLNGFFWSRMANVFIALLLLLIPGIYSKIIHTEKIPTYTKKGKKRRTASKVFFVLGNKALAGIAFFCTLLAIKFGDISLVNALAATQYIFLFIFALVFSKSFPGYFSTTTHRHELIHKISATILIVIGFLVLFV
jgi:drug/metabolite transporter (DMT)-like permease